MRRAGREDGFTLIEVAVTVVVLGLLAAVLVPSVMGVGRRASSAPATSLLRSAAPAVESHLAEAGTYEGATPAALGRIEPDVVWRDGAGSRAARDEVTVEVTGPTAYRLTTTTPDGVTYAYVKDMAASPTVTRTCGPGCTW